MKAREPELASELDGSSMFELAPVSLWIEDYHALRELFERWRADGVVDLRDWLRGDPQRIAECWASIELVKVNRRTLELYGAADLAELQAGLGSVFRDDMREGHIEELVRLWNGETTFGGPTVNYTLQGKRLDIVLDATVMPGHEATWNRVLLAVEDVTERSIAQRALLHSEAYARGLFEHSPVSLWVEDFSAVKALLEEVRDAGVSDFRTFTDVHPEFVERCMQEIRVIDVNQQTLKMFAAPDKETLLRNLHEVFRDAMNLHFKEQLIDLWNGKTFQQREAINYALTGERVDVYLQFSILSGHEASWDLVLISLTDITARKKAEAYLEFLGKHDSLTKLRNRSYFTDELARLERRGPWPVTVMMLDLNGLKGVNDELGHVGGDALLRRAGEALAKAVDKTSCAARIGGDEFALLLPASDEQAGERMTERINELTELNNTFYGGSVLSFSIGSATCQKGERLEQALHLADQRMYQSKTAYYESAGINRRRSD
ncbi:diguanylate cyclase domain-containing protein [Piscinibacter sakaiensis]|uniref:sensor domain-containing diguanylate cyclase n=1 Tax=Piscinibacter sakaiensis TaxID=1547922 RepID=UPI003AAAEB83